MFEVLEKYFPDDRIRYYHPSDAIAANHFIRYRTLHDGRVVLSAGSDDGEIDLICTTDGQALERLITALLQ